jgi:hypothetical protein
LLLVQDAPARVTGTVRLGHRAPPPRRIRMEAEPRAHLLHPDGLESDELVVDRDNGLLAALVYVKGGAPAVAAEVPANPAKLTFQGFQLRPRVQVLAAGQDLLTTNLDATLHNIHVLAYDNKETNVGLSSAGNRTLRKFREAEVGIKAKCDVHPWETSWVHVFDHPFFSLTGSDGRFSIAGLPPGRYTLEVWHERCKPRELEIEVRAGESKTLDLYLETSEGPPPFPWLKVGVGGGAVLALLLAGLLLMGRRKPKPPALQALSS